jgi:hypothetical protein
MTMTSDKIQSDHKFSINTKQSQNTGESGTPEKPESVISRLELEIMRSRGGLRLDHWQRVKRAQIELESLPYFEPPHVEEDQRSGQMLACVILYGLCVLSGILIAAWLAS